MVFQLQCHFGMKDFMKIRKIKLAVVGIGVMGVKHIDAINKTSNAKLTAVVDFKKNSIINNLVELAFKEIFEFNLIQTDPNFANFLFDDTSKKIVSFHL